MSFPHFGTMFAFTQPDGASLELKLWGDQHKAFFLTEDGIPVVQDAATKAYCYAKLSDDRSTLMSTGTWAGRRAPGEVERVATEDIHAVAPAFVRRAGDDERSLSRWETRRSRAKDALRMAIGGELGAPPSRQTVGEYQGLCLLIQFPDVPGTISRQEVANYCNLHGNNGYGNNGSVYDYFLDNSLGRFKYTNVVVDYYTASKPRAYYTDPNVAQPIRTRELVTESLNNLRAKSFNPAPLSTDDEGYIYAVNVFYAGARVNNWGQGLWPHSSHLASPLYLDANHKAFDYQITNMGSALTLATFCHENGHMVCDFPDLYDYQHDSNGAGAYCLMCSGGQSDPKNPAQICGYLKLQAGWGTANAFSDTNTVEGERNVFFVHRKDAREYFLAELRVNRGRDASLPSTGLAVWHIDELGSNNNQQMTAGSHYECALEQADGLFHLEHGSNLGDTKDLFYLGNRTSFSPVTTPAATWWDGTSAKLEITEVSAPIAPMTFKARLL
jgi:M6 family metalloprotease-like protein